MWAGFIYFHVFISIFLSWHSEISLYLFSSLEAAFITFIFQVAEDLQRERYLTYLWQSKVHSSCSEIVLLLVVKQMDSSLITLLSVKQISKYIKSYLKIKFIITSSGQTSLLCLSIMPKDNWIASGKKKDSTLLDLETTVY